MAEVVVQELFQNLRTTHGRGRGGWNLTSFRCQPERQKGVSLAQQRGQRWGTETAGQTVSFIVIVHYHHNHHRPVAIVFHISVSDNQTVHSFHIFKQNQRCRFKTHLHHHHHQYYYYHHPAIITNTSDNHHNDSENYNNDNTKRKVVFGFVQG
nr:hypothetical protein BaRGS_025993 [Batillaria attramentaria]